MRNVSAQTLTNFLAIPKTAQEIGRVIQTQATPEIIHGLRLENNFALFEQKNSLDESVFRAAKRENVSGRVWDYLIPHHKHPYLWIQFQHAYQHKRIQVVPLSDVHYGAKAHSHSRFIKYVKWIEENDDVFTFLNGDLIENAIEGSIGGAIYDSIMTPNEQIWGSGDGRDGRQGIIEILRPIAHKIMWAQPGNHEARTTKKTSIDPMRIICESLKVPYFSEPIYIDLLAWGKRFTFFCHHGTTGSQTKGGKLNAAMKPAEHQEAVNMVIQGHVHDSMVNAITRLVRQRVYDAQGRITSFSIEERTQYVVVCGSFAGYFDSYASREGYTPGAFRTAMCVLDANGGYRASMSSYP